MALIAAAGFVTLVFVTSATYAIHRTLTMSGATPRTSLAIGCGFAVVPAAMVWWLALNDHFSSALVVFGVIATLVAVIAATITWFRARRRRASRA
jgi:hypothetical protein